MILSQFGLAEADLAETHNLISNSASMDTSTYAISHTWQN